MHLRRLAQHFVLGTSAFLIILSVSFVLRAALVARFPPLTDLGPSSLEDGIVQGINNRGQLVGVCGDARDRHGALWDSPRSACRTLNAFITVSELSQQQQLAGTVFTSAGNRAAYWTQETGVVVLDPGGDHSCGFGVNEQGEVVGCFWLFAGEPRGFVWSQREGIRDLAEITGVAVAHGKDINNTGQIVGQLADIAGGQAFLWDPATGLLHLETGRARLSCANGLNNLGVIVGHMEIEGRMHACLWTQQNRLVDLNTLLPPGSPWELQAAWAINDQGQIVGYGLRNGELRDFLLNVESATESSALLDLAKS